MIELKSSEERWQGAASSQGRTRTKTNPGPRTRLQARRNNINMIMYLKGCRNAPLDESVRLVVGDHLDK